MFDHILVDEYQDTNALQADILEGMRPPETARNLTVVGDDAQSIYGFRAATVRNILEFPERFPGATVVTLEQNYRSTPPILDASNAVIALVAAAPREDAVVRRATGARAARCSARAWTKPSSATPCAGRVLAASRGGRAAEAAGRAVPRRAPLATCWRWSSRAATSRS